MFDWSLLSQSHSFLLVSSKPPPPPVKEYNQIIYLSCCKNETFSGQYYFAWNNYSEAIKCLAAIPKYRIQATEIAKSEGEQFILFQIFYIQTTQYSKSGRLKRDKKAERGMSRDEVKEAEEQVLSSFQSSYCDDPYNILCLWKVIRGIIADKMDIKGGYAKPHWTDVLWVQLVILPLTVYRSLIWLATCFWHHSHNFMHYINYVYNFRWTKFYILWLWRFGILREEYGRDEQLYVIRFSP